MTDVKTLLENEAAKRNSFCELHVDRPDPLLVARELDDDRAILLCALFAYGSAKQIVKFLNSLDFAVLDEAEAEIERYAKSKYYRFQNSNDVAEILKTLSKLSKNELKSTATDSYKKNGDIFNTLSSLIESLKERSGYASMGYDFLIGQTPPKSPKGASPYKRWFMFFRWMVRKDCLDLGRWEEIDKRELIIPLDTHTFNISKKLGLLDRKTYDLQAAIELTYALKELDPLDPLKYDFALYRIGQEGLLEDLSPL